MVMVMVMVEVGVRVRVHSGNKLEPRRHQGSPNGSNSRF